MGSEAPYIIKKGDYYYLFTAKGTIDSTDTYCNVVGRSTSLTGPYYDKNGVSMLEGGGTVVAQTIGLINGPGHDSIFTAPNGDHYMVGEYFYGDKVNLFISTIEWTADGWPVTALTPNALEILN